MKQTGSTRLTTGLAAGLGILLGALLVPATLPAPAAAGTETIREDLVVERLAEGVWLHTSYDEVEGFGRVPANGLVVVSDGEAALVDTPWTDDQTRALAAWAKERLGARLTTVVPTHSHVDCLGGLAAAHELGARSVASATTAEIARRQGLPVPQEPFEGERDVRLGSRTLEARFLGPGHTVDNIVVWLPESRILFGGDLVRRSLGYLREADLERWPATIEALQRAYGEAALVVPGHGRPGGIELLARTREILADRPQDSGGPVTR